MKEFKAFTKEIRKMVKKADEIEKILKGAVFFNAEACSDKVAPKILELLPEVGRMKTLLDQYGPAFTEIMSENAELKKVNEKLTNDSKRDHQKSLASDIALERLQSDYRRLEQKLEMIPPEIVAQYTRKAPMHGRNR